MSASHTSSRSSASHVPTSPASHGTQRWQIGSPRGLTPARREESDEQDRPRSITDLADVNSSYASFKRFAPPTFATLAEERRHRKERLAAAFRIFAKFGFSEGVAGHITARDPEFTDTFWVNPFGMHFGQIKVSDLIRVDGEGNVVEGDRPVNVSAFAIHYQIHEARPDVVAAAHAHSIYGKAWSAVGRLLDPITQDACAFYEDHVFFDDTRVLITEASEGARMAECLGPHKAAILRNHGLITVGRTVEEAVWWFVSMERCCQAQFLAESVCNAAADRPGERPRDAGGERHALHRLVPVPAALGPDRQRSNRICLIEGMPVPWPNAQTASWQPP